LDLPRKRKCMNTRIGGSGAAPRGLVIAAFAAIYLIWGSTYLAIKVAVETLPPFSMAGIRFVTAGAILYACARATGAARPSAANWKAASIVGACLLFGGNGGLVWALGRLPSGVSALLVATTPLWMVGIDWLRPGGVRPDPRVLAGLLLGLLGIALLVGPENPDKATGGSIDPAAAGVILLCTLSWAAGSVYARHSPLPRSSLLATAMEMLAGGGLLLGLGLVTGEAGRFALSQVSARSAAGFFYLLFVGSLIGFTAYVWLLKVSSPAKLSTYAYVNPVVAVLLGWAFAGEELTLRMLVAAAVIVGAVAAITTASSGADARRPAPPAKPEPQDAARPGSGEAVLPGVPETR
jgi:drug/metabolite transporter (DMT)-like permease